jgi:hypothetical protein
VNHLRLGSLLLITALSSTAHGQIFFNQRTTIEEYSLSGTPINTDLISNPNFNQFTKLAVDGNNLFVLNNGIASVYTTDGKLLNANLFSGIEAGAIAVSGDNVFLSVIGGRVAPNDIEEFTTAGTVINPLLGAANSFAENMTVSGNNVFTESATGVVTPLQAGEPQSIGEFSIGGETANPNFISTMNTNYYDVAVIGNDIFTSDFTTRTVWEFSTSGSILNTAFIRPPDDGPLAIASGGNDLFVSAANLFGLIGEYDATGAPVNANLITGLTGQVTTIAVEVPEPGSLSFLALISGAFLFRRRTSHRLN